ncbi:hypothetical protein NKH18_28440 [Streptomyces sp. M10(2022)]
MIAAGRIPGAMTGDRPSARARWASVTRLLPTVVGGLYPAAPCAGAGGTGGVGGVGAGRTGPRAAGDKPRPTLRVPVAGTGLEGGLHGLGLLRCGRDGRLVLGVPGLVLPGLRALVLGPCPGRT